MKKSIYLFLSALLITFTSCSKDEVDESSTPVAMVGKWKVDKVSNPDDYEPCDYMGWIEIKAEGKYSEYDKCDNSTVSGSWVKTADNLTITSDEFPIPVTLKIKSITESSMVLGITIDDSYQETTYKKI